MLKWALESVPLWYIFGTHNNVQNSYNSNFHSGQGADLKRIV